MQPARTSTADFGFGPALELDKVLQSGDPAYQADLVTYTISLVNTRPGVGASGFCEYTVWAGEYNRVGDDPETEAPPWQDPGNAVGQPDGQFSTLGMNSNTDDLGLGRFHLGAQAGSVQTLTAEIHWRELQNFTGSGGAQDDRVTFDLYLGDALQGTSPTATFDTTYFTDPRAATTSPRST